MYECIQLSYCFCVCSSYCDLSSKACFECLLLHFGAGVLPPAHSYRASLCIFNAFAHIREILSTFLVQTVPGMQFLCFFYVFKNISSSIYYLLRLQHPCFGGFPGMPFSSFLLIFMWFSCIRRNRVCIIFLCETPAAFSYAFLRISDTGLHV